MTIVSLAILVFVLYCILDVALSDAEAIRNFPKLVWLALVVLLPVIGGIAWLVAGRPAGGRRPGGSPPAQRPAPPRGTSGGRPSTPPPRRPSGEGRGRPKGPDDDPEFLRRLGEDLQRRDDDD